MFHKAPELPEVVSVLLRAICGFFLLAFWLASAVGVSAADYKVSYAIDAGDINDSGTVTCNEESDCKIELKKQNFTITLRPFGRSYRSASTIRIRGDSSRWGCCYFEDGVDHIVRHLTESPARLGVYVGRPGQNYPRRTSEYLVNEPLGLLYLRILDVD
jgi:hypothetical protein